MTVTPKEIDGLDDVFIAMLVYKLLLKGFTP
jgi:hypothetical protein